MDKTCLELNKNIQNRISRLKGQVNGIDKMVSTRRDSIEIVNQIAAIKAGLSSLAIEILKEESKECLKVKDQTDRQKSFETIVTSLFKIS